MPCQVVEWIFYHIFFILEGINRKAKYDSLILGTSFKDEENIDSPNLNAFLFHLDSHFILHLSANGNVLYNVCFHVVTV